MANNIIRPIKKKPLANVPSNPALIVVFVEQLQFYYISSSYKLALLNQGWF